MMDFSRIRKRQSWVLWGAGSFLMGAIVVYGFVSMRDAAPNRSPDLKSSLLTGTSRVNPQEAWVYEFRTEADLARKRLDGMEDMLSRILKLNEKQTPSQRMGSQDSAQQIGSLREDLKAVQTSTTSNQKDTPGQKNRVNDTHVNEPLEDARIQLRAGGTLSNPALGPLLPPPPGPSALHAASTDIPGGSLSFNSIHQGHPSLTPPFRSRAVRKISLSLRNARSNASLKTVDNTIPAGAFAKAVLLGGVDASASIQASSDPRPALLRITDLGTLPRSFHSDLKGCHALAACYGDISSERVFMRLEKLTCTERKTGEIVEVKVQGYVAGEDGRTGVRGSVVDRAGESMRNAMVGGFLGGIGEFLSQSQNPVTFSPIAGLAQTGSLTQANPMGVKDMMKHGAGKGVQNALDKYADFYIKRAEQVQPVIQVAAGRHVDVVFTEGISLRESLYREALGRSNDRGRYHQIQALSEDAQGQQPISDWTSGSNENGTYK